ncbi:glycosyltransferase [Rhodopseudomonas boonkerdii]|uniref:glycosyltransferase n=1 Tax=Rhodopseudomonas boonkerdii TaxID=475937 RepID=UPI001E385E9B|nr:glycosyltransferase [Rhodopseudomonas boonkerdii]UGV25857.1 glycosyltransferase [Rhodopseudomonas boonkerdii]
MTEISDCAYVRRGQVRRELVREHADRVAVERDGWIEKNQAYYKDDREFMQFLIPAGARVLDLGCGTGGLLAALEPSYGLGLDLSGKMIEVARRNHPNLDFRVGDIEDDACIEAIEGPFDFIILSDTIGLLDDIEIALSRLHRLCSRDTRLVISYFSQIWGPALKLATKAGLRMPQPETNFISHIDFENILDLAEFEPIRRDARQLLPRRVFGLGTLVNKYIAPLPLIDRMCLRTYVVARSRRAMVPEELSTTVLVPCRNERGNIENAVRRLPKFGKHIEILFVEGNSSDGTYDECERVRDAYASEYDIKVFKQPGKGKGDAVRKGFNEATGDILMILDADLTVPPETLPKFYAAIASGKGEFVNGTRLVYPMEGEAMRPLNFIANRFFAAAFSYLVNQRFTDTLCGTKVLKRSAYMRIAANRSYFGDFDPFGDFDLILGAAKQNLRIIEIPIHYASRTYGSTQISRFRDGFLLLRMVMFAFRKLKAV